MTYLNNQKMIVKGNNLFENLKKDKFIDNKEPSNSPKLAKQSLINKNGTPFLTDCAQLLQNAYFMKEAILHKDINYIAFSGMNFMFAFAIYYLPIFEKKIEEIKEKAKDALKRNKPGRKGNEIHALNYGKIYLDIKLDNIINYHMGENKAKRQAVDETLALIKKETGITFKNYKTARKNVTNYETRYTNLLREYSS